jgi:hypothetical protein
LMYGDFEEMHQGLTSVSTARQSTTRNTSWSYKKFVNKAASSRIHSLKS